MVKGILAQAWFLVKGFVWLWSPLLYLSICICNRKRRQRPCFATHCKIPLEPNLLMNNNSTKTLKTLCGQKVQLAAEGRWQGGEASAFHSYSGRGTTKTPWMCNNLSNYVFVERYHAKPILTLPASNTTAVVGKNATMRCTFLSDLNAWVYWVKQSNMSNPSYSADDQKVHIPIVCSCLSYFREKTRCLVSICSYCGRTTCHNKNLDLKRRSESFLVQIKTKIRTDFLFIVHRS